MPQGGGQFRYGKDVDGLPTVIKRHPYVVSGLLARDAMFEMLAIACIKKLNILKFSQVVF